MESQLAGIILSTPISIQYTLHRKDRREGDRSNVLAVVEKFFCDSLVNFGCLPDDTDQYIESSHYFTGEIDRENPHVDIIISEKLK